MSELAMVTIGVVAVVAALYLARSIVMPVAGALIIGITLHPVQKWAEDYRVPRIVTAVLLVGLVIGILYFGVTLMVAPLAAWLAQGPELGSLLKEKFGWLERPAGEIRDLMQAMGMGGEKEGASFSLAANIPALLQGALRILTPAVSEFLVFLGTLLFFLVGSGRLRRQAITFFGTRHARLRVMRMWGDIQQNLIGYVGTVTIINIGLGVLTAAGLYLIGFPNPIAFGVLAFALNFIPYIGPAIVVATLFGVGLVVTPSLGAAMLPPLMFLTITTIEGQFITPSIIGRRLTLSPFLVFLALAFWTWLWGPFGAFMATPLLIVGISVLSHLFPRDEDPALP